jgi:hypothetical protein
MQDIHGCIIRFDLKENPVTFPLQRACHKTGYKELEFACTRNGLVWCLAPLSPRPLTEAKQLKRANCNRTSWVIRVLNIISLCAGGGGGLLNFIYWLPPSLSKTSYLLPSTFLTASSVLSFLNQHIANSRVCQVQCKSLTSFHLSLESG